MLNMSVFFTTT